MKFPPLNARERLVEDAAERRGYQLVRRRGSDGFMRYAVVDQESTAMLLGGRPTPISATLDEVHSFLLDELGGPRARRRPVYSNA
jgi:hypothetical protein